MRVWLPRSEARLAKTIENRPLPELNATDNGGAVLVIDDEETVQNFLESALTMNGYTVLKATSGAEGIKVFDRQAETISLVLLDSSMPGMTGLQTFEKLRERDTIKPVILMSGFTQDQLEPQQNLNGLAGFLQKPFRLDELYQKVQDAMHS